MAERYSKLFSLAEDLYTTGSPVLVAAGSLLKDNQTGKVLAQLKLKNIGPQAVKAVKVRIFPKDTVGQPLEGETVYEYLDLNESRDGEFGQKNAIPLPNASTRAFDVDVAEVALANNSVWRSGAAEWAPLPKSVGVEAELLREYQAHFGSRAEKRLLEHKDLWRCACGCLNRDGETVCHACRASRSSLAACDFNVLRREKDERLAREKVEREKAAAEARAKAEASAKKTKKILSIAIPALAVCIAAVLLLTQVVIPGSKYKKAVALADAGQYEEAIAAFAALDGYKDSAEQLDMCRRRHEEALKSAAYAEALTLAEAGQYEKAIATFKALGGYRDSVEQIAICREEQEAANKAAAYKKAEALLNDGKVFEAAKAFYALIDYSDSRDRCFTLWAQIAQRTTLAAGYSHTVGLKSDGTVVAVGDNKYGQCDVSDWSDIVDIVAGDRHTVGLKSDGTVVAVGDNSAGQCNVSDWSDIVDIVAGDYHTVGLRADGIVIATEYIGNDYNGECDVNGWQDIVAVATNAHHTVGLKSDGSVVATKHYGVYFYEGECEVGGWRDIIAVAAGSRHTLGLKSDGMVVAVGENDSGQRDVSAWRDIVMIAAGNVHTIGLKSDFTVVATKYTGSFPSLFDFGQCNVGDWRDIVAIATSDIHTVGLKSDGTVVAVGHNGYGQCDVSNWTDIKIP